MERVTESRTSSSEPRVGLIRINAKLIDSTPRYTGINHTFFGESMFSRKTDASKVALAFLCERLVRGGYLLLDTQFITPHLLTLGAIEIPRDRYQVLLRDALAIDARFYSPDEDGGAANIQPAVSSKGSDLSF